MDKQKFIQKVTACRVIADDLLADAYDLCLYVKRYAELQGDLQKAG